MGRSAREGRQDPGPFNKNFLNMAFSSDVYTLGKDTKTLTIDGKNAPLCSGPVMGVYENLDQKR